MSQPVFEVTLDHNDPGHHDQMARMARDLKAWAQKHRVTQLIREHREVRPGVMRIRFYPDAHATPRRTIHQDRLSLSGARR